MSPVAEGQNLFPCLSKSAVSSRNSRNFNYDYGFPLPEFSLECDNPNCDANRYPSVDHQVLLKDLVFHRGSRGEGYGVDLNFKCTHCSKYFVHAPRVPEALWNETVRRNKTRGNYARKWKWRQILRELAAQGYLEDATGMTMLPETVQEVPV